MATNDGFFPMDGNGSLPPKGPPNPIGCIPLKKRFLWPYKHPLNEDQPPATESKPPEDEAPKPIVSASVSVAPAQEKPSISEPSTFVLPPKPPEVADEVEGPSSEVRGLPLKYAMKKRLPGEGGFWGASTSNGTTDEDGVQHGALKVCRKKKIYNSTPMVNVNLPPRYVPIASRPMTSPRHVASSGFVMGNKYGSNVVLKRKKPAPWVPQKLKPPVRQSSRLRNKRAAKTFLAKMAASSPGRDSTKGKSSAKEKPEESSAKKDVESVAEDSVLVEKKVSVSESDVKSSVEEVICTAGSLEPINELPVIMEEPLEVIDNPTNSKVQEMPEAPPPPPDPDPISDTLIDVEDEEEEERPLVIDEGPDEAPPPPSSPPLAPSPPQTEPQETSNLAPEEPPTVSSVPEDQGQVVEEPPRERLSLKIIVPKPKKSKRKKKSKSHKSDREHKDKDDKEKHRSKEERSKHKDKEDKGKRRDKEEKGKHRDKGEKEKVKEIEHEIKKTVEESIEKTVEEKLDPEPKAEEQEEQLNKDEKSVPVIEEETKEEVKEPEPEPVIPVDEPKAPPETTLEEEPKPTEPKPAQETPKTPKKKKKNGPKVVISTKGSSNQWTCSLQTSPLIKKCKNCKVVLDRLPDKLLYMQPPPVTKLCADEDLSPSTSVCGGDKQASPLKEDQLKKKMPKKKINRTKSKTEKKEEKTDATPIEPEKEVESKEEVTVDSTNQSTALVDKPEGEKDPKELPSSSTKAREESVSPPPSIEVLVKPKVKKPKRGPKSKSKPSKEAKKPVVNACLDLSNAKESTPSPSAAPGEDDQQDPSSTVSASVKNCVPPSYARVMEADTDNSLNLIQEEFRGMKHGESRVIVLTKKQYDMEGKQAEILREFSDHGVPKVELIDVSHVSNDEKELLSTPNEKSQKGGKFFSDFRKRSEQPGSSAVSRYIQKSAPKRHSAGESRKLLSKSSKDTKRKSDPSGSAGSPKKTSNSWKKAVMDQIKLFNKDPKGSDSETESTSTPPVNSRPPSLLSPRQSSVPSSPLPLSSPSITSPRHMMMMMKDSGNYANQVAGWVSDISDDDDSPRKALLASSEDGFKIPSHPLPSPHTSAPSPASQEFRTPNDLPKSRRVKRQDSDLKSTPSQLSSSDISEWECEMMQDSKDSPSVPSSPKPMADPNCFLNRTKASLKQAPPEISNKQQQPLIKKSHKVVKEPREKVKNPRKKGRRVKGKFRMEGKDDPTYMPGAPKDSLLIEEESESDDSEEEPPAPPAPTQPQPLPPSDAGYPYLSPANAPSPFWKPGEPLEGREEYARLAHSDDEQEQYEVSDEAFNARLYALYRHDRFKTRSGAKLRQIVDFTNVDWLERQQSSKGSSLSLEDRDLYSDDPSSPANTPLSKKKSKSNVSEDRPKRRFKISHNEDEDEGPPHLSPIRMDAPHSRRVCESDNDFPKLDSEHYSDSAGMLANLHSGDHVSSASDAEELTGRSSDVPFQRTEYKRRMKELYERSKKCKRKSDSVRHDNKRRKGMVSEDDDSAVHVPSPASEDDEFYSTSNMHYRHQYAPSESGSSDSEQVFLDKDLEILIRDAVTLSRDLEERLLRDPRALALYLDRMMQGTRTLCGDIEEQQQMPPCSSPPLANLLPVGIVEEEDDYGGLSVADLLSQELCTEAQPSPAYECCLEENSMDRLLSQPSSKHFGCSPVHDPFFDSDSVEDFFLGSRHDDPDFATLGKYGEQSNESFMWANVDSTVDLSW